MEQRDLSSFPMPFPSPLIFLSTDEKERKHWKHEIELPRPFPREV
jgi:hypothetical protein